jgi:protoporphyrinogen oxidase
VLTKHGVHVDVFEAGPHIGGLARSFELWGQPVDLGPHIFGGYSEEVFAFWREVVGDDFVMLRRSTKVVCGGRLYAYPLRLQEVLRGLGPLGIVRSGLDFIRAKLDLTPATHSAESLIVARFGQHLYRRFFRSYCRKLWGADPSEVDVSFAQYLLGDISVSNVLWNTVTGRRSQRERQLQDELPYARQGSGAFAARATAFVRQRGGRVLCDSPIRRLIVQDGVVTGLEDGNEHEELAYDWVISSMPIAHLARALGALTPALEASLRRLRFRSTILVYLRVLDQALLPYLWVYATDEVSAGRVTNFGAWREHTQTADGAAIFAVEYWCDPGDDTFRTGDEPLAQRAITELGVLAKRDVRAQVVDTHVVRIERSHPLHYRGYLEDLRIVRERIAGFARLSSKIGRAHV